MSKSKLSTVMIIGTVLPLMAGCASTQLDRSEAMSAARDSATPVLLPEINHHDAIPNNGTVVEYWPDHTKKSERVYRNSKMIQAVYYASDGTVVYEMAESETGQ